MSRQEESEENINAIIDNLCANLNVDSTAADKSKESFLEIKRNYTLDGDVKHWIACALYVMCRTSAPSTPQMSNPTERNCVSLTRLLRLCNMSLLQFFNKIKLWMEMSSMSSDFKDRMEHLEHKFAVSDRLFRKFRPLFQEIFTGSVNSEKSLFNFTWCLYICVKGEFQNAHDLVDMYHLLLSCLDHIFANAFMAKRMDLINSKFEGLPSNWGSESFELPTKTPCIISIFHRMKDEQKLMVEAASMKEYSYKPVIKSFFEKGILRGRADQLLGLFDGNNLEKNFNSLNNLYESYVLSVGEFDERIFLSEYAGEQFGSRNQSSGDEISAVIATFGPHGRTCPETPLSGQSYLPRREEPLTPLSEATKSLARLTAFLRQGKPQTSAELLQMFSECGVSEELINTNVLEPCNRWKEQLCNRLQELNYSADTILHRCGMVTRLYYIIFENIIRKEHNKKPHVSLQLLLSQETYQLTVYACCTEVVLHAYGVHSLRFPEVLKIYDLSAFHFYKIIELVVQAISDKFDRDIIKHLNTVEEIVLESEVWKTDSPLWGHLERTQVPASAEVSLQESPYQRRNMNGVQARNAMAENTRRQLFQDNIRPGQSLLVTNTVVASTSQVSQSPSMAEPSTPPVAPRRPNNSLILFFRKFYSLAVLRMNDLCQRLRLTDEDLKLKIWNCLEHSIIHQTHLFKDRHLDQILLCAVYVICRYDQTDKLNIPPRACVKFFSYSTLGVKCAYSPPDEKLSLNLTLSIVGPLPTSLYKISGYNNPPVCNNSNNQVERSFADIMRCYRLRPLAYNHVYRYVLIEPGTEERPAKRGDLIIFYNEVYVPFMQSYVLRFNGRNRDDNGLSPLPAWRGEAFSPGGQRVSDRHLLYVHPFTAPRPADYQLTYRFSRSPAKDLHAINTLVSCDYRGVKRAASAMVTAGDTAEPEAASRRPRCAAAGVARRLQGVVNDRQAL